MDDARLRVHAHFFFFFRVLPKRGQAPTTIFFRPRFDPFLTDRSATLNTGTWYNAAKKVLDAPKKIGWVGTVGLHDAYLTATVAKE